MKIQDNEILHKIIDFQSCIIEGRNMKTLLRANIDFFLEKSGADIITIYMHEDGNVNPEYILEKDKLFTRLLKKYVLKKKFFKWNAFVENCDKHFSNGRNYDEIQISLRYLKVF